MMPRLKTPRHARVRHSPWPPFNERQPTPLFLGRSQYRKLVVLLDANAVADGNLQTWGKEYLLEGLLSLDVIDCFRYADDGPSAENVEGAQSIFGEAVPGWAVLSPDDDSGYRGVLTANERQVSDHAIVGNAPEVAANDTTTGAYADRDPTAASAQRRADVLAAMVPRAPSCPNTWRARILLAGKIARGRSSGMRTLRTASIFGAIPSTFYVCQAGCMTLQSAIICRYTTLDRCRFRQRMASLNDLPSARRRST